MLRRVVELFWVVLVVGCAMFWWSGRKPEEPVTAPSPSASGPVASAHAMGPGFELPSLEGATLGHAPGQGPLLMLLTAPGCGGCRERAPLDKKVYELARGHGIPVWSLLVYSDEAGARAFVKDTGQPADAHLLDPQARVAVAAYGGSDAQCWVLLNPRGEIVYRGSDVQALWEAMDQWTGAMER